MIEVVIKVDRSVTNNALSIRMTTSARDGTMSVLHAVHILGLRLFYLSKQYFEKEPLRGGGGGGEGRTGGNKIFDD